MQYNTISPVSPDVNETYAYEKYHSLVSHWIRCTGLIIQIEAVRSTRAFEAVSFFSAYSAQDPPAGPCLTCIIEFVCTIVIVLVFSSLSVRTMQAACSVCGFKVNTTTFYPTKKSHLRLTTATAEISLIQSIWWQSQGLNRPSHKWLDISQWSVKRWK